MGFAGVVEENVCDTHYDVVDDTGRRDEIDEPCEDFGGGVGQLKEGQERKDHDDTEAPDWDTVLCAFPEEWRCSAFQGKPIKGPCGAIGVCVASGEDTGDQKGIYKMGETVDAEIGHGDYVRGSSTCLEAR